TAIIAKTFSPTSGTAKAKMVASTAEITSSRPRPKRSDKIDSGTMHSAKAPVAAETVSAASVGVKPSTSTKVGSIAWVEYRPEKRGKLTQRRAPMARVFLRMYL